MNGDDAFARRPRDDAQISEKLRKAFDDIAKYFSKKEWEKMKSSEKIVYVYMKLNYEVMTKLGFKVTLPPFMRSKRAADFHGNDFGNDRNHRNQVERPQMTFGSLQRIFPKDPKGGNMPGPTDCVRESSWWFMKRSATLRKMTSNSPRGYDTCP
ncbi:SSX family member 4B [Homo sapiens]|uniref:Isoform 2 of Protein SSX4 n=1 Tax=Homo sapiens TaxID=9606 RepID=O60224-2|nr:protein SSX4 isoform b [Homo sapiens]NP_783856.1 protein SSX4 isoform b [Homo sapiens]KAI2599268.1 SSX family member 4B [Homo sapiens]KAI2599270.1 SSX family member 4 [Homo sapiens]KAI3999491.1 SSX family member 4 [Homo sapiens]KAI3999492.1 SSX family member 4B [Homo sapiens]|eukprot:NP_001035702.1 protein SSX4 isoform b [Homo sapiens]